MKKISTPFIETVKTLQARVLTSLVGGSLKYTVEEMAEGIGENERQIYSYKAGENAMPLHKFLKSAQFLGKDFINPFLNIIGMEARYVDRSDDNAPAAICDLSACISSISKALEDGRIDHIEANTMMPMLNEAETQLAAFKAAMLARAGR